MEVNRNRWIEEWNAGSGSRSVAVVGLFGVALPLLIYKGIVSEFHMQDQDAGRPLRKFIRGMGE